jgi:acetylornithine deacetylase/succinyl-diaminopimelate desuccinylase-like protein
MQRSATWLGDHLRAIGLENVQMVRTPGHPIVTADWLNAPGQSTFLVYGHYDVQPPDPFNEWKSPPFEPTIRGDYLHGRGASDDKGQLWAHVKALECWLRTSARLPVNVRCVFDGEEEIGSPALLRFLPGHLRHGSVDAALLSDMPMRDVARPAITESMRGALRVELEVRGPHADLHSGNFGGALHNPAHALCDLIAQLHDGDGRITIPGFYDQVRALAPAARQYMARCGPSDAELLAQAHASRGWGEAGFTLYERTTIRPALNVTAIAAGDTGPGTKAAIPARASAQLDFRLVPDQDPAQVERLLREHIGRVMPPTVRGRMRTLMLARPVQLARDGRLLSAAAAAFRRGFGRTPVFLRLGGTVPVVQLLARLAIPTLAMGFALPGDRMHASNERFFLPNLYQGIETCIHLFAALARLQEKQR